MTPRLRAIGLAAVLFAVYASTLGLDAFADSDYGGDEPHYLLAAKSLVEDGDLDVLDEYRAQAYSSFYPLPLDMHGEPVGQSLEEPHGVGFPALIAPAFAVAGPTGVELFLAAVAAAAVALSYLLALRVVPDPWAVGAATAVGLSPPLVAYGSGVYPEVAAGAALAGAALLALRLVERPSPGAALGCGLLLATLPWLGVKFAPAGAVIAIFALVSLRRRGRRSLAIGALGVVAGSAIALVLVNQAVYGGPTPYAADFEGESATDASSVGDYLGRSYRLAALLVDRDYGLLRWAPVFALALVAAWLVLRSRGAGAPLSTAARRAALLCAAALAAQVLVAAFLAPTMFGFWFPGRHILAGLPLAVPLVALGLRRFPLTGLAITALGIAASVWIWLAVRLGDAALANDWPDAPWGPADAVFPFYGESAVPYALTAAVVAVALARAGRSLIARSRRAARHSRQTAGMTSRRYSG